MIETVDLCSTRCSQALIAAAERRLLDAGCSTLVVDTVNHVIDGPWFP